MQVFGIFSRFFLLLLHINPNDIFTVSIYCAANEIEWHVPKSDANKKIKYNTCETSMTKINEIEDNNNRSHHCDHNMNKSRGRYAKKKIHFDLIYWREDILSRSRKIHRKRNNNDSISLQNRKRCLLPPTIFQFLAAMQTPNPERAKNGFIPFFFSSHRCQCEKNILFFRTSNEKKKVKNRFEYIKMLFGCHMLLALISFAFYSIYLFPYVHLVHVTYTMYTFVAYAIKIICFRFACWSQCYCCFSVCQSIEYIYTACLYCAQSANLLLHTLFALCSFSRFSSFKQRKQSAISLQYTNNKQSIEFMSTLNLVMCTKGMLCRNHWKETVTWGPENALITSAAKKYKSPNTLCILRCILIGFLSAIINVTVSNKYVCVDRSKFIAIIGHRKV